MKAYGGVDVQTHVFLTSAPVIGESSASYPGRFTPGIHWIEGWVAPRTGMDNLSKLYNYFKLYLKRLWKIEAFKKRIHFFL
jgi:hypothetical protein